MNILPLYHLGHHPISTDRNLLLLCQRKGLPALSLCGITPRKMATTRTYPQSNYPPLLFVAISYPYVM